MPRTLVLFGDARLEIDGAAVGFETRKALALLAYLALNGRPQPRDSLALLLWPESDSSGARGALRRTLSALRKAAGDDLLEASGETVQINPEAELTCDALQFSAHLARHRQHRHRPGETCAECLPGLEAAAQLYAGDFMAGFSLRDSLNYDQWQFQEAEHYQREYEQVLTILAASYTNARRYQPALEAAHRLLALDPLNEAGYRRVMLLYARLGRREAALRQYRECVRVLENELGVAPLEQTSALYEQIRQGKIAALNEAPAEESPTAAVESTPVAPEPEGVAQAAAAPAADSLPLVGRGVELAALEILYRTVQTGKLVVIAGEAGIGKTRLAEEFLSRVAASGGAVISTRCYENESNLAYAALIEALRQAIEDSSVTAGAESTLTEYDLSEARRLLPGITQGSASAPLGGLDNPGAQARFFESVCRVLGQRLEGALPGILFIDDFQWADQATRQWVTYLVNRLPAYQLMALVTWRAAQPEQETALQVLLGEAARQGSGKMISLGRLETEAVAELLAAVEQRRGSLPEGWRQRLEHDAEGLPLFLTAYSQALLGGEVEAGAPFGGLKAMLSARLAALTEPARQVIQTAALLGRSFEYEVLLAAAGRSEDETVAALEELMQHGLLRELHTNQAGGTLEYDFTHESMRLAVVEELSQVRRRLLHRRLAESLERRASPVSAANTSPARAGQIAGHYHQAGLPERAIPYYILAGEAARRVYANQEARQHFQTALELGAAEPGSLLSALAELHMLAGEYAAALQRLAEAAQQSAPAEQARLEHLRGQVYERLGEWAQVDAHYQAARQALVDDPQAGFEARLLADWSLACHRGGDPQRAADLAEQALAAAQTLPGDLALLAQVHNLVGVLARKRGDLQAARDNGQTSLRLAEQMHNLPAQAAALNNLALIYGDLGETPAALEHAQQALELCITTGDRHRAAAIHNNLADLFHAAQQPEAARQHQRLAVALFAEIGVAFSRWQPEVWKLVEW